MRVVRSVLSTVSTRQTAPMVTMTMKGALWKPELAATLKPAVRSPAPAVNVRLDQRVSSVKSSRGD